MHCLAWVNMLVCTCMIEHTKIYLFVVTSCSKQFDQSSALILKSTFSHYIIDASDFFKLLIGIRLTVGPLHDNA